MIDAEVEHDYWQAGIGPFEQEQQVEMLREAVGYNDLASKGDRPDSGEDVSNYTNGINMWCFIIPYNILLSNGIPE